MATAAPSSLQSLRTPAEQLRVEKKAKGASWVNRLANRAMVGAALAGAVPQLPSDTNQNTVDYSQKELFNRQIQSQRFSRQIGPSAGATLAQRQTSGGDSFDAIIDDSLELQRQLAYENQFGYNDSSAAVKRGEQDAILQMAKQRAQQVMLNKVRREAASLASNAVTASIEVIDAPGEDLWLSQGVIAVQNVGSVVRTLFVPVNDNVMNIQSVDDLRSVAKETLADVVFPRLELTSPGGILGFLKINFQLIVAIPLATVILVLTIFVLYEAAYWYTDPLGFLIDSAKSILGFLFT